MKIDYYKNLYQETTDIYQEVRSFKHDYANLLYSLELKLDSKDYEGALELLHGVENYSKKNIPNENINQLNKIALPALQGLFYEKIKYAHQLEISIIINVLTDLSEYSDSQYDILRCISILLDNCLKHCNPYLPIEISIYKISNSIFCVFKNTIQDSYSDSYHNGQGLKNIAKICRQNNHIFYKTKTCRNKYIAKLILT